MLVQELPIRHATGMTIFTYKCCWSPDKTQGQSVLSLLSALPSPDGWLVLIANYIPNDQWRGMLVNIAYCLLHQRMRRGGEMLTVPIKAAKHLSPRCLSIFSDELGCGVHMLNTNCFNNEKTNSKKKKKQNSPTSLKQTTATDCINRSHCGCALGFYEAIFLFNNSTQAEH